MFKRCDWDPKRSVPAERVAVPIFGGKFAMMDEQRGCKNDAELLVGGNGAWRLCRSCARLPEFNQYRNRRPIGVK